MRIAGILLHKSITLERVMDACERYHSTLDSPGICILCGCENEGHESDARRHECEACGEDQVYGAEELLIELG